MAFATMKLPIILFGAAQLLKHAARRHPKFKARVKEHNLVAQIMTRDEEIGRWYAFNDGVITTGAGLHAKPDIKLMFKNAKIGAVAADAADQLARPDQRAKGFQSHRRRPGIPDQLVRADLDDEPVGRPQIRHEAARAASCAIAT